MTVFLGCPTHDGRIESGTATAMRNASQNHNVIQSINRSSLLAYNCNQLWCMALNMRNQYEGIKYFAMLHSDVVPEKYWLDKLIDLAEKHDADLMSAVVPIKDGSGDISTAIGNNLSYKRLNVSDIKYSDDPFSVNYQTLHEGMQMLLVNTGCMVVRIDKAWSDKVWFEINDKITFQKGQWVASVEPEDWFFSRKVTEFGGKVMATRAIQLEHVGTKRYSLKETLVTG